MQTDQTMSFCSTLHMNISTHFPGALLSYTKLNSLVWMKTKMQLMFITFVTDLTFQKISPRRFQIIWYVKASSMVPIITLQVIVYSFLSVRIHVKCCYVEQNSGYLLYHYATRAWTRIRKDTSHVYVSRVAMTSISSMCIVCIGS